MINSDHKISSETTIPVTQNPVCFTDKEFHAGAEKLGLGTAFGAMVESLRTLFDLQDACIQDLQNHLQAHKFFNWIGEKSINGAFRVMTATNKECAAQMFSMSEIFEPALLDMDKLDGPPRIYVVPLGFHPLNMLRCAALVATLKAVHDRFGPEAFSDARLYFLGGRKLHEKEIAGPMASQLGFAIGEFYGKTAWDDLSTEQRQQFCADYQLQLQEHLGEVDGFQVEGDLNNQYEIDSARQLREKLGELSTWCNLFKGDVHFCETRIEDYKKKDRDNTEGNGDRFVEHIMSQIPNPSGVEVVVCSDSIFCMRATYTMKTKCEPLAMKVTGSSVGVLGRVFDAARAREAVCALNDVFNLLKND